MKSFFIILLLCLFVFVGAKNVSALESPQLQSGQLVKSSHAEVFLVTDELMLRWIPDEATFNAMGFSWSDIIVVADEVFTRYQFGESLTAIAPKKSALPTTAEVEAAVREFFPDNPEMIAIAKCESGFRQFNSDGTVLRGSGIYIGIFQIDENIHAAYAKSLGMDIFTVEGNLAYAKHLLGTSGTRPWGCAPKTSPSSKYALTKDLKFEDEDEEVKTVQIILNAIGFPVAADGVGSAGNETTYFGSLTRAAVQRFQCAKSIVCEGSESTTGYGQVGPRTRSLLLQLAQ